MKNIMSYVAFAAFFGLCSFYVYETNQNAFSQSSSKALHVVSSSNKNEEVEEVKYQEVNYDNINLNDIY